MYRSVYTGIKFAKGYNRSFSEFKTEFAHVECFKRIPHKKRDAEMKKVHKRVLEETKQFAKDEAKAIEEQGKEAEKNAKDELSNSGNKGEKTDA